MYCKLGKTSGSLNWPDVVIIGEAGNELKISFQRTVKVPDNTHTSHLPPGLGTFPLLSVSSWSHKLPPDLAAKGGIFFPMYQKEAMWIRFKAERPFAVKIYIGGVNAVSGEHSKEDMASKLRRHTLMAQGKSIQDYIVTPQQRWLDGIVSVNRKVRQFVAMPVGSGYSVESQLTGEDSVSGLQFEITPGPAPAILVCVTLSNGDSDIIIRDINPYATTVQDLKSKLRLWNKKLICKRISWKDRDLFSEELLSSYGIEKNCTIDVKVAAVPPPSGTGQISVFIRDSNGRSQMIYIHPDWTVEELKCILEPEAANFDSIRYIYGGKVLQHGNSLKLYDIQQGSTIDVFSSSAGGGVPVAVVEMGVAAGGLIHQAIEKDIHPPEIWRRQETIMFNAQIMNSEVFHSITGRPPPKSPIDAATYARLGLPYFKLYDETPLSGSGDFSKVKSIGSIDNDFEDWYAYDTIALNPKGPRAEFRSISELQDQVKGSNIVNF